MKIAVFHHISEPSICVESMTREVVADKIQSVFCDKQSLIGVTNCLTSIETLDLLNNVNVRVKRKSYERSELEGSYQDLITRRLKREQEVSERPTRDLVLMQFNVPFSS